MGKTKKTSIANDLLDEILLDDEQDQGTIEFPVETPESESESDFEFGDFEGSRTHPIEVSESEEEGTGTMPIETGPMSAPEQVEDTATAPQRAAVGRAEAFRTHAFPSSSDAALVQSENLRLAQDKILDLEKEIERLRVENEDLGAAGETLRRRADELLSENEELRRQLEHEISTSHQEKEILKNSRDLLRKEVEELKQKNAELELRISTNIQRVRVRERELENRLELMKVETKALIRSKDEMILDIKRQMDQLNLELNNYRVKSQDLNKQIADGQETVRRTVKALRLALSMMEGEDQTPLKKAK